MKRVLLAIAAGAYVLALFWALGIDLDKRGEPLFWAMFVAPMIGVVVYLTDFK